jgi:hypothetical protein
MSNSRLGNALEGEWIVAKRENGLMELDGLWGQKAAAMDRELIIKALERQTEPISGRTLWQEIFPKPKWAQFKPALEAAIDAGQIKVDKKPGKGGGKVYTLADYGSVNQSSSYESS